MGFGSIHMLTAALLIGLGSYAAASWLNNCQQEPNEKEEEKEESTKNKAKAQKNRAKTTGKGDKKESGSFTIKYVPPKESNSSKQQKKAAAKTTDTTQPPSKLAAKSKKSESSKGSVTLKWCPPKDKPSELTKTKVPAKVQTVNTTEVDYDERIRKSMAGLEKGYWSKIHQMQHRTLLGLIFTRGIFGSAFQKAEMIMGYDMKIDKDKLAKLISEAAADADKSKEAVTMVSSLTSAPSCTTQPNDTVNE